MKKKLERVVFSEFCVGWGGLQMALMRAKTKLADDDENPDAVSFAGTVSVTHDRNFDTYTLRITPRED